MNIGDGEVAEWIILSWERVLAVGSSEHDGGELEKVEVGLPSFRM